MKTIEIELNHNGLVSSLFRDFIKRIFGKELCDKHITPHKYDFVCENFEVPSEDICLELLLTMADEVNVQVMSYNAIRLTVRQIWN